ncbi:P-loop containing nucleoside triphosphate hydrolase protein, partial [Powellomyces hirtus]
MLLLDDTGLITHLNILLIGSAHVGKTTLRKCFVRGPSSHGIPKTRARGPWRSVYDPTIEDCNILQYVLPLSNAPSNSADPRSPTDSTSSGSTISNEHESESKDNIRLTEEDLWQRNVGQRIILTLSDVGGHPFYGTIWPSAIAAADAFMLIYDVGNRQSFDAVFGFYRQILELKCARPAHLPIMLLGNMVDNVTSDPSVGLQDKRPRQVTRDMGDALAKLLRVSFNETSAMAPKSVAHCFRQLL